MDHQDDRHVDCGSLFASYGDSGQNGERPERFGESLIRLADDLLLSSPIKPAGMLLYISIITLNSNIHSENNYLAS